MVHYIFHLALFLSVAFITSCEDLQNLGVTANEADISFSGISAVDLTSEGYSIAWKGIEEDYPNCVCLRFSRVF